MHKLRYATVIFIKANVKIEQNSNSLFIEPTQFELFTLHYC